MTSYQAAEHFKAGFIFAVCRGGIKPDWLNQFFNFGFTFGLSVKDGYVNTLNQKLSEHGLEPIMTIKPAE